MIRKLGLFVLVTALTVSACGRQVTPDPNGVNGNGLQSGYMQIKYRVAQPFNFTNVAYTVVFNTSGVGQTPYSNCQLTNCQNYSFVFIVGGNGTTVASPILLQYVTQGTGLQPQLVQINYVPGTVLFNPNSNGSSTEFTITFQRSLFNGVLLGSSTPSPTVSPSTSPSASPTGSASATPQPQFSNIWYYNFFTAQANAAASYNVGATLDSLGVGGSVDTSYQGGPLDVDATFDDNFFAQSGTLASNPAAQITGGEILNSP